MGSRIAALAIMKCNCQVPRQIDGYKTIIVERTETKREVPLLLLLVGNNTWDGNNDEVEIDGTEMSISSEYVSTK